MTSLKKKMKKEGGFTLIEMLIVVAIIAILVAVSIPAVSGSLDKARKATDAANERAARTAGMLMVATDDSFTLPAVGATSDYYYMVSTGELKSTTGTTAEQYGKCSVHSKDSIIVKVDEEGKVEVSWSKGGKNDSEDMISGTTTP